MPSSAEELLIRINGDPVGGMQALNNIAERVQNVTGSLKEAALGGGSIEEQFNNVTSSLKRTVIEGLGPVGIGAAVVGGALVGLADHAIEVGAALNDFSEITSISVEKASTLDFAATVAGSSLGEMGNLIFLTQKRMAENPEEFERGLGRIGLKIKDVQDLDPFSMFMKIATSFRENTDATNRAATATELWSRQGRDAIPTLMKPLADLTEQAKQLGYVMSTTDAAAAEELTMAWNKMKASLSWTATEAGTGIIHFFKDLGVAMNEAMAFSPSAADRDTALNRLLGALPKVKDNIKDLIAPTIDLTMKQWESDLVAKQLTEDTHKLIEANKKHTEALKEYQSAGTSYESLLAKIGNTTYEGIVYDHERGIGVATLAEVYRVSSTQIEQVIKMETAATKELNEVSDLRRAIAKKGFEEGLKEYDEFAKRNSEAADRVMKGMLDTLTQTKKIEAEARDLHLKAALDSFTFEQVKLGEWVAEQKAQAKAAGGNWQGAWDAIDDVAREKLADMTRVHGESVALMNAQANTWSNTWTHLIGGVPQLMTQAFTGGGGFGGAMKGLESSIGSSVFGESGPLGFGAGGLMNSFGNKLTSMFGTGLGMALPGIGGAIGSLIGPLMDKIFAIGGPSKQELGGRDIESKFEQSFGGFQKMMDAVGKAYEATGRGAQQAQADVKALMDAEKLGGDAVKTMIDKINSAFADQKTKAAEVATDIDSILAAAKTVGDDFPEALAPMVAQLLALPGLTDAEREALGKLTGAVEPDFKKLTSTAETYGLSLTDLGPAFEQADISGRADKILTDFGALVKAGADSDHVLHGMAGSINTLVQNALKYGSTLPTALKPLIEQLALTGQLTDDSGAKLKDVTGLHFGDDKDPLAKGLNNLNTTLQKLIDFLSGKGPQSVTSAIGDVVGKAALIPKNPFGDWQIPDHAFDTPDWGGAQAAGGFYRVSRPTLFLAGERGTEEASFSGGGKSFAGMGGGITIHNDFSGSMFRDRSSLNELANIVGDAVADKFRLNRQIGLRTA
jgi:Mor family transcriptional regulator